MTIEQSLNQLQQENSQLHLGVNALTQEVSAKMGQIDAKVVEASDKIDQFKLDFFNTEEAKNHISTGSYNKIDLLHLNKDLFYPVRLIAQASYLNEFTISRHYHQSLPAGSELGALFLKFSFTGATWGGNPITMLINQSEQTYQLMCGALGIQNYYHPVVYLRGGYDYNLRSNNVNQQFVVYEQKSKYYQQYTNGDPSEYDSWCGPVDEAKAALSPGALPMELVDNKRHIIHIPDLGA